MDTFDTRLFCLLRDCYFEPSSTSIRRPNPEDVAKMIQVDIRTVKSRVRNWERRKFIKYYQLVPNYSLLGVKSTSFLVSVDDMTDKSKVLEKIRLVDGVTSILDFLGDTFLVWIAYEDEGELDRRLGLISEISHSGNLTRFLDEPFEPVKVRLPGLDWQILRSMRNDAMKSITAISRDLRVTRKTIRAHLERMIEKNVFFVRAIFDVTRVKGLIFYGLAISMESSKRSKVLSELDDVVTCSDNCFIRMVTHSGSVFFALWAEDLAGVEETVLKAKRIQGVTKVDMRLYKQVIEFPHYIDGLLDKKAREAYTKRMVAPEIVA